MQLKQNCSFELGNGRKIRFWEDALRSETPLCSSYPSLYNWVKRGKGNGVMGGLRLERHLEF